MGIIVRFIGIMILLTGCSTHRVLQPSVIKMTDSVTVIRERIVPVVLPPDSAEVIAHIAEKNGRFYLDSIQTKNSSRLKMQLKIDSMGRILARAKTTPDPIPVSVADTTTTKNRIEIQTRYVEKPMNRFQSFSLAFTKLAIAIGGIYLITVLAKLFR